MGLAVVALAGLLVGWASGRVAWHYAQLVDDVPIDAHLLWQALCRVGRRTDSAHAAPWLACVPALVLAVIWVLLFAYLGLGWAFAGLAWAACVLVLLALIDARTRLLPDALTLPLLWIGLALTLTPTGRIAPHDALLAVMVSYGVLWGLAAFFWVLRGRDGMGGGDMKLLAAIGAWTGWPDVFLVLLCASASGVVTACVMARERGAQYPFGPHLAAAAVLLMLLRVAGVGTP